MEIPEKVRVLAGLLLDAFEEGFELVGSSAPEKPAWVELLDPELSDALVCALEVLAGRTET
jgi:hypothetical protein